VILFAGCSRGPLPGDTNAPTPAPAGGQIEKLIVPYELVMEHQAELGLEQSQRDAILKEVDRAQSEMLHLQWDMSAEKEKLAKLLDSEKTDEAQALAAAERVMAVENKIKAANLTMLLRIKNALSADQQKKLKAWR
jgi:Spy/CpxP family protein refolding chaperone